MSKYNKGDKFEVEIKEVLLNCTDGRTRYLIKGFSSLIFDDCGLGRLNQINSEEPEVDWSKVPVDTPILVTDAAEPVWNRRYFAKYENGMVYAWLDGETSYTADNDDYILEWNYAKLAEVEK